jgi:hypothetical protein
MPCCQAEEEEESKEKAEEKDDEDPEAGAVSIDPSPCLQGSSLLLPTVIVSPIVLCSKFDLRRCYVDLECTVARAASVHAA